MPTYVGGGLHAHTATIHSNYNVCQLIGNGFQLHQLSQHKRMELQSSYLIECFVLFRPIILLLLLLARPCRPGNPLPGIEADHCFACVLYHHFWWWGLFTKWQIKHTNARAHDKRHCSLATSTEQWIDQSRISSVDHSTQGHIPHWPVDIDYCSFNATVLFVCLLSGVLRLNNPVSQLRERWWTEAATKVRSELKWIHSFILRAMLRNQLCHLDVCSPAKQECWESFTLVFEQCSSAQACFVRGLVDSRSLPVRVILPMDKWMLTVLLPMPFPLDSNWINELQMSGHEPECIMQQLTGLPQEPFGQVDAVPLIWPQDILRAEIFDWL